MSITQMTHDTRKGVLGLGVAVFASATFGTSGTFAAALIESGWSPGAVVTLRVSLAAVLLTVPAAIALRGRWSVLRRSAAQIVGFGMLAVAGCQLFYFNAVQRLDVGVALLLEYSGILLVVGWMWARHGHRPRRLTVIGGLVAIGSLVLVLSPSGGGIDPVGVFWALLAAAGLALFFVMSAQSDATVPPIALAWASMVVGAITLAVCDLARILPFTMRSGDVVLADHAVNWMVPIGGLALVSTAIAYAASITASRLLGAKLASFFGLTEVLFAVLFAWLALSQQPSTLQLLGGLGVLIGIGLVRADETEDELPAPEPLASTAV